MEGLDDMISQRIHDILEQKIAMGAGKRCPVKVHAYTRKKKGCKTKKGKCAVGVSTYCRKKPAKRAAKKTVRRTRRTKKGGVVLGGLVLGGVPTGGEVMGGVPVGGLEYLEQGGARARGTRAQKAAARNNPWLQFLAEFRAHLKAQGIHMTQPEIVKAASVQYHQMR